MSHIGQQLHAKNGYGILSADAVFHYLGRYGSPQKILLVYFDKKPGAYLVTMKISDFELGIQDGEILPVSPQKTLPPWLDQLEGLDLSDLDKEKKSPDRKKIRGLRRRTID